MKSKNPSDSSKKGPELATRYWLKGDSGEEHPITLSGTRVIFGEGEHRKIQAFPSFAEAKDYFERLTFLEQKKGYAITWKEEIPRDVAAESQEPFPPDGFDGELKVENGVWTVTFEHDGKVPASVCGALARRIQRDGPRVVQVICDFGSPGKAWEKAMREVRLETVQAFIFDTYFQTQTRQSENSIGDLAAVLTACPELRRFFATGKLELSPVSHGQLRELYLLGCPLTSKLVNALAQCEFPSLERLVLSLDAEDLQGPDEALLQVLPSLQASALREVHLSSLRDAGAFLDSLLSRGLPPQWKTLSLDGEWDEDSDLPSVATLEKHSASLRTLEVLGVPLDGEEGAVPESVRDPQTWRDMYLPEVYRTW